MIRQVQIFILDRAPSSFDEDVVEDTTSTIHAHLNVLGEQDIGKAPGGTLAALITIENLTLCPLEQLGKRLDTKLGFQRRTSCPRQHRPTTLIQHRH